MGELIKRYELVGEYDGREEFCGQELIEEPDGDLMKVSDMRLADNEIADRIKSLRQGCDPAADDKAERLMFELLQSLGLSKSVKERCDHIVRFARKEDA